MHGFFYIDYNQDGSFSFDVNTDGTPATNSEIVSYCYSNGNNSKGESGISNQTTPNGRNMPSFTIPSNLAAGEYLVRFKVDWSELDPCNVTNDFAKNGCMVDFTLKVEDGSGTINPANDYPVMTRTFTNNATQENRYLQKVTTTGTQTPTVFECNTQAELPYTAFTASANTYVASGATIDKTSNPIVVEQGATSFGITYFAWQTNIGSAAKELEWTQEACFIDWNQDKQFSGSNEISAKNGDTQQNTAINTGYTRTVTIPANQPAGTYRMRVVFYEPATLTEQWQNSLFTTKNNQIRNGISYDFDLQILDPRDMEIDEVTVSKPSGSVNIGENNLVLASVKINASGSMNPLSFTQLNVRYTGTNIADLNNLRIIYSTNQQITSQVAAVPARSPSRHRHQQRHIPHQYHQKSKS